MTDQNDSNMFVTLFVGAMDLATGRLEYCNAGHDAPLIIDCKENRFNELPCESNLPVGVVPGWDFKKQEIDIPAGTMLFLFTDGLTEAEDDTHQLFDESRIHEVVRQSFGETELMPQSLIKCMDDAVHAFVGDAEQSDDLTMLAIKRPA
jgi:sigma-B regulation protein RsbU (phosphoserine phosphatase)